MGVSIKKISVGTPPTEYFVLASFDGQNLNFTLINLSDCKAYYGNLREKELRLMAAEIPMVYDNYLSDTLSAFGNKLSKDDHNFFYALNGAENGNVSFLWKKELLEGCKVQLGCVETSEKAFDEGLGDFLLTTSLELVESHSKIDELGSELEKKEKEKNETQLVLNQALDAKSHLEKELYTKFCRVLNSKKSKIRELYAEIETLKKVRPTKKVRVEPKTTNNRRSRKNVILDEDVDDPGPSKRMAEDQDSLLFGSDEEEPVKPPEKRKPRTRKIAQKNTRLNGVPSTVGTSSARSRLDSLEDADDLLDDI